MKKITLVICLLATTIGNSQVTQLFITTTDTGSVAEVFDSAVIAKQNIKVNVNNLKSQSNDTLRIILPGITRPVKIIKTRQSVNTKLNSFRWYGRILGSPNSFVLLTSINSVVAGYIRNDNKIYRLQYRGNNVHQIALVTNKYAKPDKVKRVASMAGSEYKKDTTSCCDTTKEVDIMVVYTAEANNTVRGTEAMLALIDECVELSNVSYSNSGINARLNLVHTAQIDYTDQGNAELTLERLTNNTGGMFDNVRTWRDTYKADIVILIVDRLFGYAGIANVMTTNTVAFESSAYAVVEVEGAASNCNFPHEVSHVMGAGHEYCGGEWEGLYDYSHGYKGRSYNTIMSDDHEFSRIEYFSNPDIRYPGDGLPMGVISGTCPNTASAITTNNALTLNNTINTVSKFRCRDGSQCSKPPCKWYKCWVFWVGLLLASIIIILSFLLRRRRRPRI